jgi:hypothetical protein
MILAYLCLPLPLLEPMPPLVGVYFETYTLDLIGTFLFLLPSSMQPTNEPSNSTYYYPFLLNLP